jgi:hypothetical protein
MPVVENTYGATPGWPPKVQIQTRLFMATARHSMLKNGAASIPKPEIRENPHNARSPGPQGKHGIGAGKRNFAAFTPWSCDRRGWRLRRRA